MGHASDTRTSDLSGIAAMLVAMATFVVSDIFMKLVTEDLPPFQALFLRGVVACGLCGALVVVRGEWGAMSGFLHPRSLLRALAETSATLCFALALARIPIADIGAIAQAGPLILVIVAAFLLREPIGWPRLLLALTGFTGAVLVAQPSSSGLSAGAAFAFGTALSIAARDLAGRGVPAAIPVGVVIFATSLVVTAVAGLLALAIEPVGLPTGKHLLFSTISGLFVAVGQVALLLAYRLGRVASVAPFFYSLVLWGVLAGFVVWGHLPNALALTGIALIISSGVAIVVLDQRRTGAAAAADAGGRQGVSEQR